ncbi:MAG: hypothetical protein KAG14_03395 [Mycoplasmataceae bacterium]|nr:hypothetical protein [Mycoplasmataceae bacterium]
MTKNMHYIKEDNIIWANTIEGNMFLKKTDIRLKKVSQYENLIAYSMIEIENEIYEGILFKFNIDANYMSGLFDVLNISTKSLIESISTISSFLNNRETITSNDVRGYFAELTFIESARNVFIPKENSIYDFEVDGKEWEIKSFSKVKQTFTVSYQQLTNSKTATIMAYEVFESNDGVSVREMFEKSNSLSERYSWISTTPSTLLDKRYKIGTSYEYKVGDLSVGIGLPKMAIDATFIIKVS